MVRRVNSKSTDDQSLNKADNNIFKSVTMDGHFYGVHNRVFYLSNHGVCCRFFSVGNEYPKQCT